MCFATESISTRIEIASPQSRYKMASHVCVLDVFNASRHLRTPICWHILGFDTFCPKNYPGRVCRSAHFSGRHGYCSVYFISANRFLNDAHTLPVFIYPRNCEIKLQFVAWIPLYRVFFLPQGLFFENNTLETYFHPIKKYTNAITNTKNGKCLLQTCTNPRVTRNTLRGMLCDNFVYFARNLVLFQNLLRFYQLPRGF